MHPATYSVLLARLDLCGARRIKGPISRGLSARAPYFHNGSARTLLDVVRFYEARFGLALTPQQEWDLLAFLSSL